MNLGASATARNFFLYLSIIVVPIVGILLITFLLLSDVKQELESTKNQLNGLDIIRDIQENIAYIQKLRGLSLISTPNAKNKEELGSITLELKLSSARILDRFKEIGCDLATHEFSSLLKPFLTKQSKELSYEELNDIIDGLINLVANVSYRTNLVLQDDRARFVLVDNAIFLYPRLLELSAQLRANMIALSQNISIGWQNIGVVENRVEELRKKANFNCELLKESELGQDLDSICVGMTKNQQGLMDFITSAIFDKNSIEANEIYTKTTCYLDSMLVAKTATLELLEKELYIKLSKIKSKMVVIIFMSLFAIGFVSLINRIFYLKNRGYIQTIQELSIRDSLTNLYNRRYFDEMCSDYLAIYKRKSINIALMMMDVDFFKQYNDTYGHQAGDKALVAVANALSRSLKRKSDKAFRVGGEEFAILCIVEDKNKIVEFANKIRQSIEDLKIEHKSSYVSQYVTISVGAVVFSSDAPECKDMYRHADNALYKAKQSGRNRVVAEI